MIQYVVNEDTYVCTYGRHFSSRPRSRGIGAINLVMEAMLNYNHKTSISPECGSSRERLIAAMATLSLDPHLLVRLDAKAYLAPARSASEPRCAFFASGTPVRSMRPRVCSLHEHGRKDSVRLISQNQTCSDAPTAFGMRSDVSSSRKKERLCARLMRARA